MNHPSSSAPRRGRLALNVAVSLLGLLLVGQVAAIGWALHRKHGRSEEVRAASSQKLAWTDPAVAAPADATVPQPSPPTEGPAATLETAPAIEAATAPPTSTAPPVESFPLVDERVKFFLGSALASREKGDMKAALTQLRAACDLQPGHPRLIYELASTYEKMSLPQKAAPLWDQLTALGEGAGVYFKLAQARFEQGDVRPPREVETPLRLGKILERSQQDPSAGEAITLRIPVQALDGAAIEPGRVSVVTQFYDAVGREIVETDAATDDYRWLSGEFPTWTTNSVEFLDQPYRRHSIDGGSPDNARRYHGYVVKLYYNDHLQDVVAKPAQLASRRAEPGERGLQHPAEIPPEGRVRPVDQLDDSLFPPLPQ